MFGLPSLRIGRVFGIPLEVNPTWLIIFILVSVSLGLSYYPALFDWSRPVSLAVGTVTALLFFASIVIHEMSHSLVARAGGMRISKVTLFLFGGVAQMEEEPDGPGREFAMAVAGPGASLLLSAISFGSYLALVALDVSDVVWAPLQYLAAINLSVAVFNLLPGFPLDGGRVLRALLWAVTGDLLKATRIASRAGQVIGWLMVGTAVLGVLNGLTNLIWFGLIGWFIATIAEASYRQQLLKTRMSHVPVSSIMTPSPTVVPGEADLETLVHDHLLGGSHSRYPVVANGAVIGIVSLSRIKGVPKERWSTTRVAQVADQDLSRLTVDADAHVDDVLTRLAGDEPGALLVVRDGMVVGIVTRADVIERLRRAD